MFLSLVWLSRLKDTLMNLPVFFSTPLNLPSTRKSLSNLNSPLTITSLPIVVSGLNVSTGGSVTLMTRALQSTTSADNASGTSSQLLGSILSLLGSSVLLCFTAWNHGTKRVSYLRSGWCAYKNYLEISYIIAWTSRNWRILVISIIWWLLSLRLAVFDGVLKWLITWTFLWSCCSIIVWRHIARLSSPRRRRRSWHERIMIWGVILHYCVEWSQNIYEQHNVFLFWRHHRSYCCSSLHAQLICSSVFVFLSSVMIWYYGDKKTVYFLLPIIISPKLYCMYICPLHLIIIQLINIVFGW